MPDGTLGYLLIDEVSYIRDWDKAVKYAADAGMLERVVLVATGSDRVLIQEARMRLPGRRGREEVVDFHLFPLSFREVVTLKRGSGLIAAIDEVATEGNEGPDAEVIDTLFALFDDYLLHGGYLTAINDLAKEGRIGEATLALPLTHKSAISAPRKCQAKARCAANGDPLASAATRAWRFRGAPFG